ncbi:MAG: cupredoxin domain-containing protein [Anaerolineae bacterium]|nr:cupredoxin domain-containing protein [Anaerolineae bacterium]
MKTWTVPIILAVVLVGSVAYAATLNLSPQSVALGETISGTKRWPGTWSDETIRVQAGEELGEPDVIIDITVLSPVFVPSEIRVKQGQVVRLVFHGQDSGLADMPGVDEAIGLQEFSGHGFTLLGPYDIWITGIRKGVTREVTFRADVVGEFAFECTVFCSPQHYLMSGVLIVEPE